MAKTQASGEARSYSTEAAGYLLGKPGLIFLAVVLVLSAWFGQVTVAILVGLTLSAAGLAWLWSRLSLARVHCERTLSEDRLFPGESTELKLRLVNRKLLPLPWVQVDDEVPLSVSTDAPVRPGNRPGRGWLSEAASLLWYSAVNWRHQLKFEKRGYYPLGPLAITSGDIFGLYPRSIAQPGVDHVIVYPKVYPLAQLGLPSMYPLGETRAERRIFEDPTRTIGVRDYTSRDSLRYVHWKASARHQGLQIKVFEPTTTLRVALFLAVDSFRNLFGPDWTEEFELGISTAASIANHVVEQRSPVGLYANAVLPDSGQPVRIPSGGGGGQLVAILEALAKLSLKPSGDFDQFVRGERGSLAWGTTVVLVLCRPQDALPGLLGRLKEGGFKPVVLQVGEAAEVPAGMAGWNTVKHAADILQVSGGGR